MNNENDNISNIRYGAYLRRSDETGEKQMLSLPAQLDAVRRDFPDLNIVEIIEESRSAFKPDNRPKFKRMLEQIEKGKIDGIVAWHPNRLSRNEIDAAAIIHMTRKGVIKDLKFCTYRFENTPEGIMMLQIIMSQSQYESAKQAREVRRGMNKKAAGGEKPGQVPLGYKKVPVLDKDGEPIRHPKESKFITRTDKDPERYDLVKKMWDMLLSGAYTVGQIRQIANDEWGFRTLPIKKKGAKRIGSRPLGTSQMYRIFNNPFYAGYIKHEGELSKGNHPAMVTLEQFDYVQKLLGDKGTTRVSNFEYAYKGQIICGECGCAIVGKHREKLLKGEQKVVDYIYYRCTRKSQLRACSQGKYTKVEDMEEQIDEALARYTILPEFRDLALDILNRNHKVEVRERTQIYETQQKRRAEVQAQIDELIGLRTKGYLDDEEYTRNRNKLKLDLIRIDELLRGAEKRADDWLELTERAFNFATYARVHFRNGTPRQKGEILRTLGQNLVLKDGKLEITPNKWLVPIENSYPALEKLYLKGRTNKKALSTDEDKTLMNSWRARRDSNPRHSA